MSELLVVGSVALDTIETPLGRKDELLGGAATYFSFAARHFVPVHLVGVVGKDFPAQHTKLFSRLGIELSGLSVVEGKTFRWHGKYEGRMNKAETISTQLNVLENFVPKLPMHLRAVPYVFLGNTHPHTQMATLEQLERPQFVLLDTMNFWIERERVTLLKVVEKADGLCINEEEAFSLVQNFSLMFVQKELARLKVKFLVVKQAEHGALLLTPEVIFAIPAYPVHAVKDPTGAGDAFAGGFMGYLAAQNEVTLPTLKRALLYGAVMGSFAVEEFGTAKLQQITPRDIDKRYREIVQMITL